MTEFRAAVFRSAPQLGAVAEARLFSTRTLAEWALDEVEEPVTAIVAELVANAVIHAATDLQLRLTAEERVRIEVTDLDTTPPVLRSPEPLQLGGGRGMMIVEVYSNDWGILPGRDGKTVWAEVGLVPAHEPWSPAR